MEVHVCVCVCVVISPARAAASYYKNFLPLTCSECLPGDLCPGLCFSYTAGEPQIGTTTSGTNSFLVGFQVPSDMTVGIEASLGQGVEVSIFPNPVSDEMYIEFEGNLSQTVYLQLYDAKGSVVEGYDFQVRQAGITSRNLSALTSGTYFLRLSREDGQLFKTLPLIKL